MKLGWRWWREWEELSRFIDYEWLLITKISNKFVFINEYVVYRSKYVPSSICPRSVNWLILYSVSKKLPMLLFHWLFISPHHQFKFAALLSCFVMSLKHDNDMVESMMSSPNVVTLSFPCSLMFDSLTEYLLVVSLSWCNITGTGSNTTNASIISLFQYFCENI